MRIQVTLLGKHALALHHLFNTMFREDGIDNAVVFVSILSPVNMYTIVSGIALKHFQVVSQVGLSMFLYLAGQFAQLLPFRQGLGHTVTLLTYAEEGLVMARHDGIILHIPLGSLSMFGTHSPEDNICAT